MKIVVNLIIIDVVYKLIVFNYIYLYKWEEEKKIVIMIY
jgi:hypothetical protein